MSGVFGFIGRGNAPAEVMTGLQNLSHRGQESWGIVSSMRGGQFVEYRQLGSVFQSVFPSRLNYGMTAIGHVRYPTTGETTERNSQPIVGSFKKERIAVTHNGHIPRYRQMMEEFGSLFQTDIDTELILHMIARSPGSDMFEKIENTLSILGDQSAFSLIILHNGNLIAARDPFGFRPLSIARRGDEDDCAWAIASETCAFHGDLEWIGDVEPGQMSIFDGDNVTTRSFARPNPHPCIVECLDFASPASTVFSTNCYDFREKIGQKLAQLETETADVVVPIPRAAIPAASGFHHATGIGFKMAIVAIGEIGRIFVISTEKDRYSQAERKFQINGELLKGKEVFLIDSLLVRGSTALVLIPKLREAGATKIHLRLTAPPPRFPCLMGMAMAKPGELLAKNRTDEQLKNLLGVDSFRYLSTTDIKDVAGTRFCDACFTGNYPFSV